MKNKGFTLVELLVVISIIGVLSTVGLVVYQGQIAKPRDAVRKNDLRQIALALETYYQKNSRYPCTDNYSFPINRNKSSSGGFWITDTSTCGNKPLDDSYINQMPQDPQQTDSSVSVLVSASGRGYDYWSGNGLSLGCSDTPGQSYILFTRLENTNDPDRNEIAQYKGCDSTTPILNPAIESYKQLYFLTNWQ